MTTAVPVLDQDDIERALTAAGAVAAIEDALRRGIDIENDAPRLFSPVVAGEFLLMPTQSPQHAGIKVVTIAPRNTERGLPKIQAWYLLFDAATLSPVAILDGAHLTLLRTPAVTAVAVRALLAADPRGPRDRIASLAVIGSGPQAEAHVRVLAATVSVGAVSIIGRTPQRVRALVERLRADGFDARVGTPADLPTAEVIVTVTSSSEPVLARAQVADDAIVAAVGSHGTDHRELAADLIRGADLVVEARASALRENGNVLVARPAEEWRAGAQPMHNVRELVSDSIVRTARRPAVYTGVGMSWEDLAVVEGIMAGAADLITDDRSRKGAP
ncbi:ornithine cyclodeaminase family protein [Microbacterium gorillae]|uniref:ornithine cyclodeaminase family protein n=1 Tax=Microbacterium gorillae TaxID=1231063 RepID=UPI000590D8E4|nr:ornithine cyclodeaminase family protein [Microbacterium gorillae]